jgi:hypothetical protein
MRELYEKKLGVCLCEYVSVCVCVCVCVDIGVFREKY